MVIEPTYIVILQGNVTIMWDALDHAVRQRDVQPRNLCELADALIQE